MRISSSVGCSILATASADFALREAFFVGTSFFADTRRGFTFSVLAPPEDVMSTVAGVLLEALFVRLGTAC